MGATGRGTRLPNSKTIIGKILVPSVIVLSLVMAPGLVYAAANSDSTTVNANIASTISVSVTGTPVDLAITPVTGGSQTTAKDDVAVSTNNTDGYTLSIKSSTAQTSLNKNGTDTIAASSATPGSSAVLANNTWGYRVDSATIGDFGSGPTSASADQTSNTTKFAGITASDFTIKSTSSTASGDTTAVWYSAKADTSKPDGTYTNTVTYTATTK